MLDIQELGVDEVLSTTRSVRRRLDFDRPVSRDVVRECLALAMQAPSASNVTVSRFLVIDDPDVRASLAGLYRQAFEIYRAQPFAAGNIVTGDPVADATQQRVMASAAYLAENFHRVPVIVIPCVDGWADETSSRIVEATSLGSVIPAAWSFCLAARSRGLGTAWTTMHLIFERETAAVLGIPYETVRQLAMIPVAHTKGGEFRPAPRKSLDSVVTFY